MALQKISMFKTVTTCSLLVLAIFLNSCASGYKTIDPKSINYASKSIENNILFEYKYDLLEKKYKKNETKKDIKLIAVKITNNTSQDLVLGRDFNLAYESGNQISLVETDRLFKEIKQSPASYLWYLLLSPVQFYSGTTTTNHGGYTETKPKNLFPVGLILGPGLAGGNMVAAHSANSKFQSELREYNIMGKTIKPGETTHGIIGVYSKSYDAIKIKM